MDVCPSNSTTGSVSMPRPYVQRVTPVRRDTTQKNPERGGRSGFFRGRRLSAQAAPWPALPGVLALAALRPRRSPAHGLTGEKLSWHPQRPLKVVEVDNLQIPVKTDPYGARPVLTSIDNQIRQ